MSEQPKFDDVDAKLFHSALQLLFRDLGVDNLADAQARIRELKEREIISAATAPTEWINEYETAWRCKRCGGYFTTMDACVSCGTKQPERTIRASSR